MKEYLTYNKIINLWAIYFYHRDWHDQTLDYISEKYCRTFSSLPDKNSLTEKRIIEFNEQLNIYKKKWKYKSISEQDVLMLLAVYHLSNGFMNLKHLVHRYNDLFTSYEFINEINQMYGLHELLKQTIQSYADRYESELLPYKRLSTIIRIRKQLK